MKKLVITLFLLATSILLSSCTSTNNRYSPNTAAYTTVPWQEEDANIVSSRAEAIMQQILDENQKTIDNAVMVTFDEISRSLDGMQGSAITVKGEIVQVLELDNEYQGLISITYVDNEYMPYYTDSILYRLLNIPPKIEHIHRTNRA